MLVLTRQIGEIIDVTIGDTVIEVIVIDVRGPKVRVGIHAPRHVKIDRREVTEAIAEEAAAK